MAQFVRLKIGCMVIGLCTIASVSMGQDAAAERKGSHGKVGNKLASAHAPARAMPMDAIVVLDPGVDPRGEPRPELKVCECNADRLKVVVQESVHIHRYYPTSPCEFQAQYFSGGPTIVCARNPRTNQQVYVHLDLARGWPKVRYGDDEIEYKYPEESYTIHFERCGDVTTSTNRCGEAKLKCQQKSDKIKECSKDLCDRLKLNQFSQKLSKEGKDLAAGSKDSAGMFIGKSSELFISALNIVPGYQLLKSNAEDEATKHRDRAVDRVSKERQQAEGDIKTLR